MYEEIGKPLAQHGRYRAMRLRLPVGGRVATVWGPDVAGRICRMGAYASEADAMRAAERMADAEHANEHRG